MAGSIGNITTDIIKNGLVFNMDAANRASTIPSSATTKTFNTIDTAVSGSFINGTEYDSSTITPSYVLDGTTDYIDIGTISSLNANTNFSISLWCNESVRRYTGTIFSSGTGTGNLISVSSRNGTISIFVGNSGYKSINLVSLNVWHHVVLTVDNTTAKVYINNGSPTTETVGSTSSVSGTLAKIGELSFLSGYNFDGNIGPIHIYNRTLSASEVLHNYNALKSRFE